MGLLGSSDGGRTVQDQESALADTVEPLTRWFDRNGRDLPWRKTRDPYAVWISEVMLHQTQVQTVIPYWRRWMDMLPGVRELAGAPPELVLKLWEGLGYYSRARNLQRAARQILEQHNGVFPQDPASILSLPGVGRYTAGAIASIALDQPEPIVDGNVIRVLTRFFALEGDPKAQPLNRRLWELATALAQAAHGAEHLGDRRCARINQSLMELGATVCSPGTQPACGICPVAEACEARRRGQPERFPELPPRVPITGRFFATGIIEHEGRYLLRLREDTEVNRGFWEFPNWETGASDSPESVLSERLGVPPDRWSSLPDLRHHITRYRMTQRVRCASFQPSADWAKGTWLWATATELESLAMTAAHRKLTLRLAEAFGKSPQLS
jgi:A/G-specific adenine glycosylase